MWLSLQFFKHRVISLIKQRCIFFSKIAIVHLRYDEGKKADVFSSTLARYDECQSRISNA
jgi:hypothetical protein